MKTDIAGLTGFAWNFRQLLKATHAAGPYRTGSLFRNRPSPPSSKAATFWVLPRPAGKTAAFALPIPSKIIALATKRRLKIQRGRSSSRRPANRADRRHREAGSPRARIFQPRLCLAACRVTARSRIAPARFPDQQIPGRLDGSRAREGPSSFRHDLARSPTKQTACSTWASSTTFAASRRPPTPQGRRRCSATMPNEIAGARKGLLHDPVRVEVAPAGNLTASEINRRPLPARSRSGGPFQDAGR